MDTQWFEALISALGAHLGQHLELHDRGVLALEDERGQMVFLAQLTPDGERADLYAPFLDYDPAASPETELAKARTLLELNGNEQFLGGFVVCCDSTREQYILRGSVAQGASPNKFIELVTDIVAVADELREMVQAGMAEQEQTVTPGAAFLKV